MCGSASIALEVERPLQQTGLPACTIIYSSDSVTICSPPAALEAWTLPVYLWPYPTSGPIQHHWPIQQQTRDHRKFAQPKSYQYSERALISKIQTNATLLSSCPKIPGDDASIRALFRDAQEQSLNRLLMSQAVQIRRGVSCLAGCSRDAYADISYVNM